MEIEVWVLGSDPAVVDGPRCAARCPYLREWSDGPQCLCEPLASFVSLRRKVFSGETRVLRSNDCRAWQRMSPKYREQMDEPGSASE